MGDALLRSTAGGAHAPRTRPDDGDLKMLGHLMINLLSQRAPSLDVGRYRGPARAVPNPCPTAYVRHRAMATINPAFMHLRRPAGATLP